MDNPCKVTAMSALLHFIEAERVLRPLADQFEQEHPELFAAHVEGVRAELNKPKWDPRKDNRTLAPLLRILAPHKGTNLALGLLPYYADEYERVVSLRNAIGHGHWEKVDELGGAEKALEWASSFFHLVMFCTSEVDPTPAVIRRAVLQMGDQKWPWPTL